MKNIEEKPMAHRLWNIVKEKKIVVGNSQKKKEKVQKKSYKHYIVILTNCYPRER